MGFVNKTETLIIGSVMLLVFAVFLGAIEPQISAELDNTDAHPNGPLAQTVIALLVVGLAIALLLSVFVDRPPRQGPVFQDRQFGGEIRQ